jgi:hypothetical protein
MDLIKLPPPGGDGQYRPPGGDGQYRPAGGDGQYRPAADDTARRRAIGWTAAILVVLLVAMVAVLNQHRTRQAASSDQVVPGVPNGSPQPGPDRSGQGNPGQGSPGQGGIAAVACPQIRDEQSHLGYTCIDNYLRQDGADIFLGLRIALNHEVEPNWVISEGSGDPTSIVQQPDTTVIGYRANHGGSSGGSEATSVDVQREVQRRTALALKQAYGDSPTARTLSGRSRMLSGVQGYELATEITINPAYRQAQGLQVRTERLWVVGLPTVAGVGIFMMSIPDDRSDLWPKAEAVVGTVHLI